MRTGLCRHRNFSLIVRLVLLVVGFCTCDMSCRPAMHVDLRERAILYADYDSQFRSLLSSASEQMSKNILTYESIGPNLLPKKVSIAGTHYELGYLIGLIAKEYFGDPMKKEITRKTEEEEINRQIIEMYQSIDPKYLELVTGVAEAWGLSLDRIDLQYMEHWFFTLLWWRLFQYQKFQEMTDYYSPERNIFDFSKCSIVSCYLEEDQDHLIGRNFDVSSDRPHFLVITDMEGAYRTMGNACYMLYHWIEDGLNEKGLFVGVATSGYPPKYNQKEQRYPDRPAVQVIHMARIILDTCASVSEALELIGSVRIWFPVEVNHLLIADKSGQAAAVEFDTDRNMVTFCRDQSYLVLTNTAYQEGIDFVSKHCGRYRKAVTALKSGIHSADDLFAIMQAIQIKSGNSRTLWTSITDLSKQEMDVRLRSENFMVPHIFNLDRYRRESGKNRNVYQDVKAENISGNNFLLN